MRTLRIVLCVSILGFLAVAVGLAQQKPLLKRTVKPGIVSGRVFAITRNGDLKPARMASLYLLYLARTVKNAEDSAGMAWMDNLNKALEKDNKDNEEALGKELEERSNPALNAMRRLERGEKLDAPQALARTVPLGLSEKESCHKGLIAYHEALSETLHWAFNDNSDEKKGWQVLTADADEEGFFNFAVAHPGSYILIARGRAGLNDAFWVSDIFNVNLGGDVSLKMSQPSKACLDDTQ